VVGGPGTAGRGRGVERAGVRDGGERDRALHGLPACLAAGGDDPAGRVEAIGDVVGGHDHEAARGPGQVPVAGEAGRQPVAPQTVWAGRVGGRSEGGQE